MREYLLGVIGAAMIVGVIGAVLPASSGEGMKKYVNFIGALCVLGVLSAPLGSVCGFISELAVGEYDGWLDSLGETEEYEKKFSDYLLSLGEENISDGLRAHLCEKFEIPTEECHISVRTHDEEGVLTVDSVIVILSGKSIFMNPYEIEEYVTELLGCTCSVTG